MARSTISICLVALAALALAEEEANHHDEYIKEFSAYDGWYNNRADPTWGAAEMPLLRRLPAAYEDSVYIPSGRNRPNPRAISEATMKGDTGLGSYRNLTAFAVFFGQQVVEEVLDAQRPGCPVEYFNIEIPKGDPLYDPEGKGNVAIPLPRSRYDMSTGTSPNNPRMQINEITPWIDGGLVYGIAKVWADGLRKFDKGLLAWKEDREGGSDLKNQLPADNDIKLPMANPPPPVQHHLLPVSRHHKLGNPRGNENAFLLTFGVFWFRVHNWYAGKLLAKHPRWSDERLFNEARQWTIAIQQHIYLNEWLPQFLSTDIPAYAGYNPALHPGIAEVFQTSAMRFGHTMVPPGVYRRNAQCEFRDSGGYNSTATGSVRTCLSFWNPRDPHNEPLDPNNEIEELMMGMASQIAEREDHIITEDLRGFVFGPLDFSRRDLMAINIQRGRDHGLPDYNTARVEYGLARKTDWSEIHSDRERWTAVKEVYEANNNTIDDVDIWVGGLMETDGKPGELFTAIIKDQFLRIRDGDRMWYANKRNGLFTDEEIAEIEGISMYDLIMAVTSIPEGAIQRNPFQWLQGDPCQQPKQMSQFDLSNCSRPETFDYYKESEAQIPILLAICIVHIVLVCLLAYLVIRLRRMVTSKSEVADSIELHMNTLSQGMGALKHIADGVSPSIAYGCHRVHLAADTLVAASAAKWKDKAKGHKAGNKANDDSPGDSARQAEEFTKYLQNKKGHHNTRSVSFLRFTADGVVASPNLLAEEGDQDMLPYSTIYRVDVVPPPGSASVDTAPRKCLVIRSRVHDIVLDFTRQELAEGFLEKLVAAHGNITKSTLEVDRPDKVINNLTKNKNMREKEVEMFFQEVYTRIKAIEEGGKAVPVGNESNPTFASKGDETSGEFVTIHEAATYFRMDAASFFIDQVLDSDDDGCVSLEHFVHVVGMFSGTAENRAEFLFRSLDQDNTGMVHVEDIKTLLASGARHNKIFIAEAQLSQIADGLEKNAGSKMIPFKVFNSAVVGGVGEPEDVEFSKGGLGQKHLERTPTARSLLDPTATNKDAKTHMSSIKQKYDLTVSREGGVSLEKLSYVDQFKIFVNHVYTDKIRELFLLALWVLITTFICIERWYYYYDKREHVGLRTWTFYGVATTRAAASGQMWAYSSLFIPMCTNTITALRGTPLKKVLPLDSAHTFHKIAAWTAVTMTLIHVAGHFCNFYNIVTQPANDLTCYFREVFHGSDELPDFFWWVFRTVTGLSGFIALVVLVVMVVFAQPVVRRASFSLFKLTHKLWVPFIVLTFVHGTAKLVYSPSFWCFSIFPIGLYCVDRLVGLRNSTTIIRTIKGETRLLHSGVVKLAFKKPEGFKYNAGMWIRIALANETADTGIWRALEAMRGKGPYHPFTISSAPSDSHITCHIRTVGPWTSKLWAQVDSAMRSGADFPKLYVQGPFGEAHEDWEDYEVPVLVAGGIGVTPFTSVIKDLVFKSNNGTLHPRVKKVYFVWVARNHKAFEWVTQVIAQVKEQDKHKRLSVLTFLTQGGRATGHDSIKSIIRESMTKTCDGLLGLGGTSGSGIPSGVHLGRPDFVKIFGAIATAHPDVKTIGSFACGPPRMGLSMTEAALLHNESGAHEAYVSAYTESF